MTVRAHLYRPCCWPGGARPRWCLFVPFDSAALWPHHDWAPSRPVPTVRQRENALAELGYQPISGAEWRWTEDTEGCCAHPGRVCRAHPGSVYLRASIEVCAISADGEEQ